MFYFTARVNTSAGVSQLPRIPFLGTWAKRVCPALLPETKAMLLGPMRGSYPTFRLVLVVVLVLFYVFYPLPVRVAPDWVARVVDENGQSVTQVHVRNFWQEYSLEQEQHEENSLTGLDGMVHFSPHTMRASLASRARGCYRNFQQLGVHASCGAHAQLVAYKCGYGYLWTDTGRKTSAVWLGWSRHMNVTLFMRRCPPDRTGPGCYPTNRLLYPECFK
jgi:hypothetical protein